MTIAICGNHQARFCTESELAWTFESMGHVVVRLQENVTSTEEMLHQCHVNQAKLFLYIHTHGWTTPGTMSFDILLKALRESGIKTASFHLDRYWGLDIADKRESRIGQHPFWHTDVVFTADGGHEQEFANRGVTHQWLPPAIAARHCVKGNYQQELACDVAFVGQKNYHPEYQFRTQLIDWLQQTYGSRFRRFAGDCPGGLIREQRLNDLYASVKVIVGDSCFAGAPFYWSDRVPETLGRGGFLIHPETKGLVIDGLITFQPGDLSELKSKIDYYLLHEDDRRLSADIAMDDVKERHTYTNRMKTLLTEMNL